MPTLPVPNQDYWLPDRLGPKLNTWLLVAHNPNGTLKGGGGGGGLSILYNFTLSTLPPGGSNPGQGYFVPDGGGTLYQDRPDGSGYAQLASGLAAPMIMQICANATLGTGNTVANTVPGTPARNLNIVQGQNTTVTSTYDTANDKVDTVISCTAATGSVIPLATAQTVLATPQQATAGYTQVDALSVVFTPTTTRVVVMFSAYMGPTTSGQMKLRIQQATGTGDPAQVLNGTGGAVQIHGSGVHLQNASPGGNASDFNLIGSLAQNVAVTRTIVYDGMITSPSTSYTWTPMIANPTGSGGAIGSDLVSMIVYCA